MLKLGLSAVLLVSACSSVLARSNDPLTLDPADPRIRGCGAGPGMPYRVSGAFAVKEARDISSHIPALGAAPELQTDDPAIVVIIPEPVTIASWAGISPPSRNAVCVLMNGEPTYYLDVDLAGAA